MGLGTSSVLWYRCVLPALCLHADWCGVVGEPPNLKIVTGLVKGATRKPEMSDYRVVILQQVSGHHWLRQIKKLQARGVKVLYEVDDYLHGVWRQPGHAYAKEFTKKRLQEYEMCMRRCDGIIVSTDYIAQRYKRFNTTYLCRNGIDYPRFALGRVPRAVTTVMFAGATGHVNAVVPWLRCMVPVFKAHPEACFLSIGDQGLGLFMQSLIGPDRALGIPFGAIETYPAAMTLGDIAIAPVMKKQPWYHAKSDLRWLEASACGIPTIADPEVYPEIEHGVTGFHAKGPMAAAEILHTLLNDAALRKRVGRQAKEVVIENRSAEDAAAQWYEVCCAVVGDYQSLSQVV